MSICPVEVPLKLQIHQTKEPQKSIRKAFNVFGQCRDTQSYNWMDVASLEVFKVRLDGSLSNLIYRKMPLSMAGGLD